MTDSAQGNSSGTSRPPRHSSPPARPRRSVRSNSSNAKSSDSSCSVALTRLWALCPAVPTHPPREAFGFYSRRPARTSASLENGRNLLGVTYVRLAGWDSGPPLSGPCSRAASLSAPHLVSGLQTLQITGRTGSSQRKGPVAERSGLPRPGGGSFSTHRPACGWGPPPRTPHLSGLGSWLPGTHRWLHAPHLPPPVTPGGGLCPLLPACSPHSLIAG